MASLEELRAMYGLEKIEKKEKKQDYSKFEGRDNTRGNNSGGSRRNNSNNSRGNNQNANAIVEKMDSTAPYNFVSVPNKILSSKLNEKLEDSSIKVENAYREYIEENEQLSGRIDLDIKLLSPLFIRAEEGKMIAPIDKEHPIIPGSSIRGMIKNLLKVVTCGAIRPNEDYTERHIYYRCIMAPNNGPAWMKPLHALYSKRMTSSAVIKGKSTEVKNAKPGFLIKIKDKYFIAPSRLHNPKRIFITEYLSKFHTKIDVRNDSRIEWHNGLAYIITGSQNRNKLLTEKQFNNLKSDNEKKRAGKQQIRYLDIHDMDNSKAHWKEVPFNVIEDYRDDIKRKGVNLLKYSETKFTNQDRDGIHGPLTGADLRKWAAKAAEAGAESLIPCFFLEENGVVSAFGHGQCFRVPYANSIGSAIPQALQKDTVDYADAIFGKKEFWGSRVFFEDAQLKENTKAATLKSQNVVLGEPNPTSYQLYLKQQNGKPLVHWDMENSEIRGYKMYWHKNFKDNDWNNLNLPANDNTDVTTKITPIATGTKFAGSIRFRNLSKIELGALMMVFDLNGHKAECAYKLGQGKSLGLGSVDIKASLKLDKEDNYETLFGNDGWLDSTEAANEAEYLKAFKAEIEKAKLTAAWESIMSELANILSIEVTKQKNWNNKVKTMEGSMDNRGSWSPHDNFINRIPMKNITDMVR